MTRQRGLWDSSSRLGRFFLVGGVVVTGLTLDESAGSTGLAGWVAMVVGGAATATLLWPLHSPVARLPGRWARRVVGGLAGALIGAAASALIAVPLRPPLAALSTRLPQPAGACAWVAVALAAWLPVLLSQGRAQGAAGVPRELCSFTVALPAFYGWFTADLLAVSWLRPASPLLHPMLVGTMAGALAGAFGLVPWRAGSRASDVSESAGEREGMTARAHAERRLGPLWW